MCCGQASTASGYVNGGEEYPSDQIVLLTSSAFFSTNPGTSCTGWTSSNVPIGKMNAHVEDDLVSVPASLFSSDGSTFYGGDVMRAEYHAIVETYSPLEYWDVRQWSLEVFQAQQRQSLLPKNRKRKRDHDEEPPVSNKLLKTSSSDLPKKETSAEESKPYNYYEGVDCAMQLAETVPTFLARLPPSTTTLESIRSPWIYVCNPLTAWRPLDERTGDFREAGTKLLEDFSRRRRELEESNPDKAAGTITRWMSSDRANLEKDISILARKHNVVTGKWMLFPSTAQVDDFWATVVKGTVENRLGHIAKVAIQGDPERVICIYTDNYEDENDVLRVLKELQKLHLVPEKGIYYKADAYTYLDIMSGNEYKLKASMYSSKDLLKAGSKSSPYKPVRKQKDLRKFF